MASRLIRSLHPSATAASSLTRSSRGVGSLFRGADRAFHEQLPQAAASEPWLLQQAPTNVTRLSSGMRVASQYNSDETLTVGVWIDAGSRYENRENNGCAHFLEHMAFKGTKRRSRTALEKEVENMGAHLNAYTSREQTVYYAKCFKDDLEQGVDILSDILTNSTLDKTYIDFERGVILREMEEVEKIVEEVIFDRLHLTAFNQSPLGFTILGPVENIQSLTQEDLRKYIQTNYTADRIVVCAVGPIDHADFVRMCEEKFPFPKGTGNGVVASSEKPLFCGAELLYRSDEVEHGGQAHCAVAFEGVSWCDKDSITFMVMQATMGSYKHAGSTLPALLSSNRLTKKIAALEGGIVDSYGFFNTCYRDTGVFGFYTQCEEPVLDKCVYELMWGCAALANSVTEEEVERGKRGLKATLFSSLDSTTAIAEDIGRQLLVYGRRIPARELMLRIDAVDAQEVRRVASKYLMQSEIAVTGLGPLSKMPSLEDL
eukprot:CAMPEP_0178383386 /NCGR_PEP_ID=MMETSP0689_2-20121128/6975_1 /TAXON_ID=160604 /ORGANISM="Amphidinium massartii, Strain CS-259" /LENGTH=486 /DNA_ID=CAMNT_0020003605 /DNA_START=51 /DNA_END=1507 /DNA_ORIENTATION=+